jgi:hypothetical protein
MLREGVLAQEPEDRRPRLPHGLQTFVGPRMSDSEECPIARNGATYALHAFSRFDSVRRPARRSSKLPGFRVFITNGSPITIQPIPFVMSRAQG